jgi:hypothetical protein
MGIVPKDKAKRINWYKVRLPQWAQDPQGIGSSPEQIARLEAAVEEARLARVEQYRAQLAARMATQRLHQAMEELTRVGSSTITGIRARGAVDPAAYSKASVPPRRKKHRLPPPGKPYDLKFELQQVGWLTLSWKCDNHANAPGATYELRRQLNGVGEFELLGLVGGKKYVDKKLPAGVTRVTYQVRAIRTTGAGEVAHYSIDFGSHAPAAGAAGAGASFQPISPRGALAA